MTARWPKPTWATPDGRVRLYRGNGCSMLQRGGGPRIGAFVMDPPYGLKCNHLHTCYSNGAPGATRILGDGDVFSRDTVLLSLRGLPGYVCASHKVAPPPPSARRLGLEQGPRRRHGRFTHPLEAKLGTHLRVWRPVSWPPAQRGDRRSRALWTRPQSRAPASPIPEADRADPRTPRHDRSAADGPRPLHGRGVDGDRLPPDRPAVRGDRARPPLVPRGPRSRQGPPRRFPLNPEP